MALMFDLPIDKKVYDFIVEFIDKNGFAPTHTEISEYLGRKTFGSVGKILHRLKDQEHISFVPNKKRGIRLLN